MRLAVFPCTPAFLSNPGTGLSTLTPSSPFLQPSNRWIWEEDK